MIEHKKRDRNDERRFDRRLLGLVIADPRMILQRSVGAGFLVALGLISVSRMDVLLTLCRNLALSDRAADIVLQHFFVSSDEGRGGAGGDSLTGEVASIIDDITALARAS
jgi:hypothetical protein